MGTTTQAEGRATKSLMFDDNTLLPQLYGGHNAHLNKIEQDLSISIANRGNHLTLEGEKDSVEMAESILMKLWNRVQAGADIGPQEIDAALRFARDWRANEKNAPPTGETLVIRTRKKHVSPRSPAQAAYLQAMETHEMVFGLGPAGTGKTYLAVAAAVRMFLEGKVDRMVFCRPAVEAGERLGFLPGDMKDKIDPYLRPIYDSLHDMLPGDFLARKVQEGDIEIAPLAFMRGRTLGSAFVILDEAQNATPAQMKMFLTRMGENARVVVTGDPSQSDLPDHTPSGLADAVRLLGHIPEIKFINFTDQDVVRHPLVGKIVKAYDKERAS
ncbi:MAG: PhoH family protein [Rhodospirillales bacterium]|nr:PhoH family protein [Rhodospirillales bacterium]